MTPSERALIVKAEIPSKHALYIIISSYIQFPLSFGVNIALKVIMHVIDMHNDLITSGR